MKTLTCLLLLSACSSLALAQRNCGTMQHLDHLRQQDPTLDARHADYERQLDAWIQEHPQSARPNFPLIPGFVPTGDADQDRVAYAKAKAVLVADPATSREWLQPAAPAKRDEKNARPAQFKVITKN